jgi:hypothetical protein
MAIPVPNCLVCDKELKQVFEELDDYVQPIAAVSFDGSGAYGSRYDMLPMNESRNRVTDFLICICDDCLEKAVKEGKVLIKETQTTHTRSFKVARPGKL